LLRSRGRKSLATSGFAEAILTGQGVYTFSLKIAVLLRNKSKAKEQIYCERCGITSPTHLYYQGLEALHLPAKCYNPLSRNDVKTVREVLIFLCSSAQIRNFGALSATTVREYLAREKLLPAGGALPCCNAKTPRLDLEVEVFRTLNTHS